MDNKHKKLKSANELLRNKNYSEAIILFEEILVEFGHDETISHVDFNLQYAKRQANKDMGVRLVNTETVHDVVSIDSHTDNDKLQAEINAIAEFFDTRYYLAKYTDIERSGVDPVAHYCTTGWREGRNPTADFSTGYYMESNPDVALANINPFWHYIVTGKSEGRVCLHPGGRKAEVLKYLPTVSGMIKQWQRSDIPIAMLSHQQIFNKIEQYDFTKIILSYGHDNYLKNAGGVQLCISREQQLSRKHGYLYLNVSPWQPMPTLALQENSSESLVVLILDGEELGVCSYSLLYSVVTDLDLKKGMEISHVVHSFLGHSIEEIANFVKLNNEATCFVWLHDFFTLCLNYALQRNNVSYCGAPSIDSNSCGICMYGEGRSLHLKRIKNFFDEVNVKIISPSDVALDFWLSKSSYRINSATTLPHLEVEWKESNIDLDINLGLPVVVAYMGYPASHKGWDLFEELVGKYRDNKKFKFVYFGVQPPPLSDVEHYRVHSTPDNYFSMVNSLQEGAVDYVIHWGTCFETFSFTTHEAIAAGSLVITNPESGNVSAVVAREDRGFIFKNAALLYEFFDGPDIFTFAINNRKRKIKMSSHVSLSEMALSVINIG